MGKMTVDRFVEELQAAWGKDLVSVVLFGSRASGDPSGTFSDTNLLVTARALNAKTLQAAVRPVERWMKAGNPPPILMTASEIRESADVFPIEYADLADSRKILHGPDPFKGLALSRKNLRVELEHEFRGKLMRLRAMVLAAGSDRKRVALVLLGSVSTFLVLMRAAVRLFGIKPPLKKADSLAILRKRMVFDDGVFRHLDELRRTGKKPEEAASLLDSYLTALEEVIRRINKAVGGV